MNWFLGEFFFIGFNWFFFCEICNLCKKMIIFIYILELKYIWICVKNCNDLFWDCNVFLLEGVGKIK